MTEEQFTFPTEDIQELSITVDAQFADEAADIATMVVPYGIYLEDYRFLEEDVQAITHDNLIDDALRNKDRSKAIVHLYLPEHTPLTEAISFVSERLTAAGIPFSCHTALCKQEDWANHWKQYFHCLELGERLLIRPLWEEIPQTDRVVLSIEPGAVFGTGAHETTRLCLKLIERYTKQGFRMLDVGCGSGILAIASLLLGAETAHGIDIDPSAVRISTENARVNGVQDRYDCFCGSLTEQAEGKYDLVAANIVADILLQLLPEIPSVLKSDGILLLSGIVDTREQDILDALDGKLRVVERLYENGWVALAVTPAEGSYDRK